jgi:hypothetical protein
MIQYIKDRWQRAVTHLIRGPTLIQTPRQCVLVVFQSLKQILFRLKIGYINARNAGRETKAQPSVGFAILRFRHP